jgi:hypothetical protein
LICTKKPFLPKLFNLKAMISRGVRPVTVSAGSVRLLQAKASDSGSLSSSFLVDEEDLVQTFGERVSMYREWNSDLNIVISRARFKPPLSEEDAESILYLVKLYNQRRDRSPKPISPPLKTD